MTAPPLPTVFDPTTCVRKGLCPVTQIRGQNSDPFESHSLYYEQHGKGTKHKILFIMGLNSSSFGWNMQVKEFGAHDDYTLLVFDNRGVGNSGYPRGPYSTSGMAEDIIVLLDHVGWTADRDLHVVGISLGGMIAQELASRIPKRIASLLLAVTTPGGGWPWHNLPPWFGLKTLLTLTFTPEVPKKVKLIIEMLFPITWLDAKAEGDPKGRTNRQVESESYLHRLTTTRPQELMGHLSQMAAALTHYVSPARLRTISSTIPKVVILTGDEDHLVRPSHSRELKQHMPEAELVEFPATGHAIHIQRREEFKELLERTIKEGSERSKSV